MGRALAAARAAWRATVHFRDDRCFDRATVIAYFALLSFLPLAVLLVTIGALALGSLEAAEKGTEALLENVLQRLPPEVMVQVDALREQVWSGLPYLLLVLWTASKVFSKIEHGLDHVFRVEERRPWARRKIFAVGFVGFASLGLVTTVVLGGVLNAADRFIDTTALAPLKTAPLYQLMNGFTSRYLVPWGISVAAFVVVYWLVPARSVPWRAALVAGLVAGSLWEALKFGFTYYISHVANYTRTYGALATVVVFLLWVNLSASLLLWGGELAAVIAGAREGWSDQGESG